MDLSRDIGLRPELFLVGGVFDLTWNIENIDYFCQILENHWRSRIMNHKFKLNFDKLNEEKKLINSNYAHGSNANNLVNVSKHGLLTRNDLPKGRLKSGEDGYTSQANINEPIRNGVSLYEQRNAKDARHYAEMNPNRGLHGHMPVIYGVDYPTNQLSNKMTDHPLTQGKVHREQIKEVYVRPDHEDTAKGLLRRSNTVEGHQMALLVKPNKNLFSNESPVISTNNRDRMAAKSNARKGLHGNVEERLMQDTYHRQNYGPYNRYKGKDGG